MNKTSRNSLSAGQLLKTLSNRELNTLVQPTHKIWPGQRRPSFTQTVRKYKNYPFTNRPSPKSQNQQERLSLPSNVLKKKYQSVYPLRNLTLKLKSSTLKNQTKVAQNRQISNRSKKIEKILDQKLSISKKGEQIDDYVIDYMAFNFIGKVIDNPELWKTYVHKRQLPS